MGDYTPTYLPGNEPTVLLSADVVGGQVLVLTADNTAAPSSAASNKVIGIAVQDGKAGTRITYSRGGVQNPNASAAIPFGTPIKSAAAGRIAAWVSGTDAADLLIGTTLTTAVAAGNTPDTLWRA